MASFMSMAENVLYLIITTLILIVVTISVGPVMDMLSAWLGAQPAGLIPLTMPQLLFGLFYGFIIVLEIALFVNLFIAPFRRTDYSGEDDF